MKANIEPALLQEALEAVRVGVAILDTTGLIHYANQAAVRHVDECNSMSVDRGGMLNFRSEADRQAFRALVKATVATTAGTGLEAHMIVQGDNGTAAVLEIYRPASPTSLQRGIRLLLISASPQSLEGAVGTFRQIFGLSRGEAALMAQIGEGMALKEIAIKRRVTYETVRAQLRSLMNKTGTQRQVSLARLAWRFAVS